MNRRQFCKASALAVLSARCGSSPLTPAGPRAETVAATGRNAIEVLVHEQMTVEEAFLAAGLTYNGVSKNDWQTNHGTTFAGYLVNQVSTLKGLVIIQIGTSGICYDIKNTTVLPNNRIGIYLDSGPRTPDQC